MAIDPVLAQKLIEHAPDIAAVVLLLIAIIVAFAVSAYRRNKQMMRDFNTARFAHQTAADEKLLAEVPSVDMGAMLFPKVYTPTHKALSQENLLMHKA
jgi:hypothetical protein